jgi:hypothetical protein
MKKATRKPFVVPQVKEQASLVGVTLISGGGGQTTFRRGCFGSKKRSYSGHYHHNHNT